MSARLSERAVSYVVGSLPVKWYWWGTLTFCNTKGQQPPGPFIRERIFFRWLRTAADTIGVHPNSLRWVRRGEVGRRTLRPHYHFLMESPIRLRLPWHKFALHHNWVEAGGGASSPVEDFSVHAGAQDYLVKLGLDEGRLYEMGKFGHHDSKVTFSRSLVVTSEGH